MMELYKGYVLTKNKQSIEKFKDRSDLKTYEQVKDQPEFAGILGDETILIDIDDKDQAEVMMNIVEALQLNCRVYETTRGKHFLFKNNGVDKCYTHVMLACGLTADIKIGTKNSYQVLKFNDAERFIEWDVEDGSDYDTLPKFMRPVKPFKTDFINMDAGTGRNSALFTYILHLTAESFSKDESKEIIGIINDYVLKDKLSKSEIDTITRDEAFPKNTFFKGATFLHEAFGDFIINNEHVKRINGQLHIYRDGAYIAGTNEIERAMLKHMKAIKTTQRNETMAYINIMCSEESEISDANNIAFRNGIYDLSTRTLKPFSPDIIVTNKIPWDYNVNAYSELGDTTLNKLSVNDQAIRMLLEECIGYMFYRRNELSKAFFMTGGKSNGKSTFLNMIKAMLGKKNYSALDLDELDERFSVATMSGMLANIGDDISDEFLHGKPLAIFKKIVSGNDMKGEMKGEDAFFFNPYVKLLFSANDIPRMKDKTGAVLRRLVIIPFNATFSKNDPDYDAYITWKLSEQPVIEYMIKIGIDGLHRVIENQQFTTSVKVEKEIEEYNIQNNPILLWIQEAEDHAIENQPTRDVHKSYKIFCMENGFQELTLSNFSKELNRILGLSVTRKRINGKQMGIYTKGQ